MYVIPYFSGVLSNCCVLEGEVETKSSKGSRVITGSIPLGIDFHL